MTRALRGLLSAALFFVVAEWASVPAWAQSPGSQAAPGWKVKFDGSGSSPVIVDGVLYVGSADGAVYALDSMTGATKWRFQTGDSLSPATSGAQVITVPPGRSAIDVALNAVERQRREGSRRVDMAPAVANGTVFIGSGDHSFYAIEADSGKKRWSYKAGRGMASNNNSSYPVPPAIVRNGTVYFVTDDGLHAADALTGERKWLFETLQEVPVGGNGKRTPSGPVLDDGVVFLTAWPFGDPLKPGKSFLYAVDAATGKARWVTSVEGTFVTEPVTSNGFVFFAVKDSLSSNRGTLHGIDRADGQVKWTFSAALGFGGGQLLVVGSTLYFGTDKSLSAVEPATGRQQWSFSADSMSGPLRADDRHLYVVTHKGSFERPNDTLHALALSTGQENWSQRLSGSVHVATILDGVVYAGGEPLHALDAATGKQLWSTTKGLGSAQLISGGRIFLISPTVSYFGRNKVDQGYLSAIDTKTGRLTPAR